jgi:hypothetical protein
MYCTHCFANLFKDDPRTAQIRTKSKETKWVSALVAQLPYSGWVHDKPLYVDFHGGCCATKRRIDLRLLVEHETKGVFWLCIEIDEHQHKSYAAGYDEARYNDLFLDFSGRYMFLRVNPDPFRKQGQRLDPPFEARLHEVVATIRELIKHGPMGHDLIEITHLFYDA